MQQNCYVFKEEKMHSPPVFFFCHLLDYLRMDGGGIFVHMCDNNVDFVCGTQRNLFAAGTHICLVGVTFTPLAFSNSVSTYTHIPIYSTKMTCGRGLQKMGRKCYKMQFAST